MTTIIPGRFRAYAITQQIFREIMTSGNLLTHGAVIVEEGMPSGATFVGFQIKRYDQVDAVLSTDDEALLLAIFSHESFPLLQAGEEIPLASVILRRLPFDVPGIDTNMALGPDDVAHFMKPGFDQGAMVITVCSKVITNPVIKPMREIIYAEDICRDCWPWRLEK